MIGDILQWVLDQLDKPVKMLMYRFNLDKWSCRHCDGNGVCTKGFQNHSCQTCLDVAEIKYQSSVDVKCSICDGTGRELEYFDNQRLKNNSRTSKY